MRMIFTFLFSTDGADKAEEKTEEAKSCANVSRK
jgi:hypothetical protein